jgi:cholest-4-en-3-one 26-monooxygenase
MSATLEPLAAFDLVSATSYAEHGYPHEAWKRLRSEAPVHFVERPHGQPFWAITRHEDITRVSRDPHLFLNAPRLTVTGDQAELPVRMLLNMDPPEHHAYRSLANKHFTPRSLARIAAEVDSIATAILDDLVTHGTDCEVDFVERVSSLLPIWVIAEMLGVPRADWQKLLDWTNRIVGAADPSIRSRGDRASRPCTTHRARCSSTSPRSPKSGGAVRAKTSSAS